MDSLITALRARYPRTAIYGYDPAVSASATASLGVEYAATALEAFKAADCLVIQNDNPSFEKLDVATLAKELNPGANEIRKLIESTVLEKPFTVHRWSKVRG